MSPCTICGRPRIRTEGGCIWFRYHQPCRPQINGAKVQHAPHPLPPTRSLQFASWCHEVCHLLCSVDAVHPRVLELLTSTPPDHVLEDCLGGEPRDAFDAGDTAVEYAALLVESQERLYPPDPPAEISDPHYRP